MAVKKRNNDDVLLDWKTEYQAVIACIVNLADSADFKGSTFHKHYSVLTVSCFESLNDNLPEIEVGHKHPEPINYEIIRFFREAIEEN